MIMTLCAHGRDINACADCNFVEATIEKQNNIGRLPLPLFDAEFIAATKEIKEFIQGSTFEHYPVRMVMFKIFSMKSVIAYLGKDEGFELAMKRVRIREFVAIWVADYLKTPKKYSEIDWSKV